MKYIIGENREQMVLFASSLDDATSKDNEIRLIDATKNGMKRAEADVGLIFVAFNMRRLINIIGFDRLISYLISVSFF